MRFGHFLMRKRTENPKETGKSLLPVFFLLFFSLSFVLTGKAEESELLPGSVPAGTVLTTDQTGESENDWFYAEPIGEEVFSRIDGKTYPEGCPLSLDELSYLRVLHYNFDHEIQVGELIVNADLSETFLDIFRTLFEEEYEIYSMYLADDFWTGDALTTDTASIAADNTSAFSYRVIETSGNLSNHASGRAIDINPLENPYLTIGEDGSISCEQEGSIPYLDRTAGLDHMIDEEDPCYQLFTSYGFTWGGSWSNPVDYQHFEKKQ